MTTDVESAFWLRVAKGESASDCWTWVGQICGGGYGLLRKMRAHRLSYEINVGPIPPGLVIDHLCRNRACVNPAHLEPVTNRENILRGHSLSAQRARKTHCVRGHEFTEENTYRDGKGRRYCRECQRHRSAARWMAMKGEMTESWTCPTCGAVLKRCTRYGHEKRHTKAQEDA